MRKIICVVLPLFSIALFAADRRRMPLVTPAVNGPYRVDGAAILDASGHRYLVRGVRFPPVTFGEPAQDGFGAYSATSFVTLRHRANLNAVRFPLDGERYLADGRYRQRVQGLVGQANHFQLLVILEGKGPDAFWQQLGLDFASSKDVLLAVPSRAVSLLRREGYVGPLITDSEKPLDDPQLIYEVRPRYASLQHGDAPWRTLPGPVLVDGMDPDFDVASAECEAFPADPGEAAALLRGYLKEFDERNISWTISTFLPGKLVTDYRYYNWSKLDNGWVCGQSPSWGGVAMELLAHLWAADPHDIFAVSQQRGSFQIARGGVGAVYGRILADEAVYTDAKPMLRLANVSVRIRDARGVIRVAPLLGTGAGWSYSSFVVPEETAEGPAEISVVRTDGSKSSVMAEITAISPGLWTAPHDGRGPAIAFTPGAKAGEWLPAWQCSAPGQCTSLPIGVGRVRLDATGLRHVRGKLTAYVDDVEVPVVSCTADSAPGRDRVILQFPATLRGRGEVDVHLVAGAEVSNVVRVSIAP